MTVNVGGGLFSLKSSCRNFCSLHCTWWELWGNSGGSLRPGVLWLFILHSLHPFSHFIVLYSSVLFSIQYNIFRQMANTPHAKTLLNVLLWQSPKKKTLDGIQYVIGFWSETAQYMWSRQMAQFLQRCWLVQLEKWSAYFLLKTESVSILSATMGHCTHYCGLRRQQAAL